MRRRPDIPEEFEEYRDAQWRREGTRQVETAFDAERFIEQVGFAYCLTDCRRPGPSLYVAVCGRRDAVMPRNVQKDPEASLTWVLKDELIARGNVYYAKLARGKAMFLARRMIPHFHAIWGIRRTDEKRRLSKNAQRILKALRNEWEMATIDLREDSAVKDRATFARALDELQAAMIVVPSQVFYQPKFTYLWTLAIGRFPDALRQRVTRDVALREIARCFLTGAGMTIPGELARVTGLSRPEAGRGNRALVAEGYATTPAYGLYHLAARPGQTLLELHVAGIDLDRFASLFQRLNAVGITFTTLGERQTADPRWLEQFTFLDNQTRSTSGNPEVPRSVAAMRDRLKELALDPAACFLALDDERWIGYTVLDTAHSSSTRLRQSWTGVRPAYQRRGIGTALKVLGVRYARQHGYAFIDTAMRTSNVASQALSRRVGFRPPASALP